jgi:hypothetical protein
MGKGIFDRAIMTAKTLQIDYGSGMQSLKNILITLLLSSLPMTSSAYAEDEETSDVTGHRLGFGLGLAQVEDGTRTYSYFTIGGEYEYRFQAYLGAGLGINHIFSSPNMTLFALPQAYVHPLQGSWYINLGPVLQTGGDMDAHVGFRIGSRLGITLGDVSVTPQINVDFINGGRNYIFGIGVGL